MIIKLLFNTTETMLKDRGLEPSGKVSKNCGQRSPSPFYSSTLMTSYYDLVNSYFYVDYCSLYDRCMH